MPMINAFYGMNLTLTDFMEMGKEMLRQERSFNLKAGIGPSADRLPDWMRTEPLPPTNSVFDVPQGEIDELFDFQFRKDGGFAQKFSDEPLRSRGLGKGDGGSVR